MKMVCGGPTIVIVQISALIIKICILVVVIDDILLDA